MASGWNLWVWLVSVVVRRYMYIIDILIIIITFPYSTCINSFFWQYHPYFFVHILNVFLYLMILLYIGCVLNDTIIYRMCT